MTLPFAIDTSGIRLAVRLTPRSSKTRIIGLIDAGDGNIMLKVAVTEVPEAGKANEALISFLAEILELRRRDFTLILGAIDRRKLVHIAGDPMILMAHLKEKLEPWLE